MGSHLAVRPRLRTQSFTFRSLCGVEDYGQAFWPELSAKHDRPRGHFRNSLAVCELTRNSFALERALHDYKVTESLERLRRPIRIVQSVQPFLAGNPEQGLQSTWFAEVQLVGPIRLPGWIAKVMAWWADGPLTLRARESPTEQHLAHGSASGTEGEGRISFEPKSAEGNTKKQALRSLNRQISNARYRPPVLNAR